MPKHDKSVPSIDNLYRQGRYSFRRTEQSRWLSAAQITTEPLRPRPE